MYGDMHSHYHSLGCIPAKMRGGRDLRGSPKTELDISHHVLLRVPSTYNNLQTTAAGNLDYSYPQGSYSSLKSFLFLLNTMCVRSRFSSATCLRWTAYPPSPPSPLLSHSPSAPFRPFYGVCPANAACHHFSEPFGPMAVARAFNQA
jgi:hypothetical protein